MSETNEFEGIIERLSNPLAEKKASLLNTVNVILSLTWLILIVPVAVKVWGWAF